MIDHTPIPQATAPAASTVYDYVIRNQKFALEMMSHAISDEMALAG